MKVYLLILLNIYFEALTVQLEYSDHSVFGLQYTSTVYSHQNLFTSFYIKFKYYFSVITHRVIINTTCTIQVIHQEPHSIHTRVPTNTACWCQCLVNMQPASPHLASVLASNPHNQFIMSEIQYTSVLASALIKPGQIWVTSGSDLDHYSGQWIVQVTQTFKIQLLYTIAHNYYR